MSEQRFAIIRTRFEGIHQWPDAPQEVDFLRFRHRHEFHVTLKIEQNHDNRDIEYILAKRALDNYLIHLRGDLEVDTSLSCEQMAIKIAAWASTMWGYRSLEVEVSEDGENGALLRWTK